MMQRLPISQHLGPGLGPHCHGSIGMALIRRYAPMATAAGAKMAPEARSVNFYLTLGALQSCWNEGTNIVNLLMGCPIDGCWDVLSSGPHGGP